MQPVISLYIHLKQWAPLLRGVQPKQHDKQ
nr:MAG TPA: hypothetical protein [Caudoviricetes sp.]